MTKQEVFIYTKRKILKAIDRLTMDTTTYPEELYKLRSYIRNNMLWSEDIGTKPLNELEEE